MTAITLQQKLIKKIAQIEDVTILKSVEMLLKAETKPRKLSDLQRKLIEKGIQEMKEGKGKPNEILMKELDKKYV
jgi:hypothetical protein